MARNHLNAEAKEMYRVRTDYMKVDNNELIRTEYHGPYANIGTAKAERTRVARKHQYYGSTWNYLEVTVEVAEISVWTLV